MSLCAVECAYCLCIIDLDLDPSHIAHVCECGGSWSGTVEGGDFVVIQFPPMPDVQW